MVQLYNDNVGEVLRKYSADSSVTVGPNESNVSATGVQQIVAGNGINLDPAGGQGVVTVSANLSSALTTYTGNLQAGNITSLGNVTANFYLGNGFYLTGISAANIVGGYSNANVANYLQVLTSNVTTTANIAGAYILGNGRFLTGLPEAYSNANVANYLPTYTGNIGAGNITVTNDVAANYITATFDITAQNIYVSQDIQANNYYGGNITVNETVTANNVAVAEDVSSNTMFVTTLLTIGEQLNGADADFGGNVLVGTDLIATGNVSGAYVFGNGAFLTGLPAGYSNANVANYLPTYTGNLQSGNLLVIDSVVIQGNLQVQGNTTYINSNVVNIDDKDIVIANGAVTASQANGAGLIVGQGNLANIIFNNPANAWTLYPGVQTTGNVSGTYILGNGYFLTGVQYGNLVGAYGNANVSNFLANGFGSNTITTTGNIQAGTVKGTNFQATSSAGGTLKNSSGITQASWGAGGGDNFSVAVSTNLDGANAQIDISPTGTGHVHIKPTGTGAVEIAPTNTGSINNMVIGNVTPAAANVTTLGATGNVTAAYYFGNGYFLTGIQASNIIGAYGNVDVSNFLANGFGSNTITTTGNVTAGYFIGNGSQLTGISAANIVGGYSNANVANYLQVLTSNVTTTANVQANYFIGNGLALTGLGRGDVYSLQYKDDDGNLNGVVGVTLDTNNTGVEFAAYTTIGTITNGALPVTPGDGMGSGGYSGVAYGNGRYVAIAAYNTSSNIAINSTNGTSWSYGNLPANITYGQFASSVIFAAGNFVVSTRSNTIYTSTDGTTWNTITANANVHSIQYSNGSYSAVLGANVLGGTLAYSTNLTSWSNVVTTWSGDILNRAVGNNIFALSTYSNIGGNFLINVYTSTDAVTFTASSENPVFSQTANVPGFPQGGQMAYNGVNWILLKPNTGSTVPYSPDTDDQVAVSETNFATIQLFSKPTLGAGSIVDLAAGGGLYLAVGGIPTDQALSSYDGRNWSRFTTPYSYGWGSLAYGNNFVGVTTFQNYYAVFGGQNPANLIVPVNNFFAPGGTSAGQVLTLANVSTGAVTWSNSSGGSSYSNANVANYLQVLSSNITTTGNIQASHFIGDGSQLTGVQVAVSAAVVDFTFTGSTSNGAVTDEFVSYAFSSDYVNGNGVQGNTWTEYTTAAGDKIAVSDTGVYITDNEYSVNGGTTWATLGSSPATIFGITFANVAGTPTWVRVTSTGIIQYNTNANGIPTGSWTQAAAVGSLLYPVAYGNGVFVAGGTSAAYRSSNGTGGWTASTGTAPGRLRGLLWDGARWLAVGADGVYYSTDNGATWTAVGSPVNAPGFAGGIAYNGTTNGQYRISGGSATTLYWCNGNPTVAANWVAQTSVANISAADGQMAYIDNLWYVTGAGIWRSTSGNANIWIADTLTGSRGATVTGIRQGPNAVVTSTTAEVYRIPFNVKGVYNIGLPADSNYGANTLQFNPSNSANANVAAQELGNLITANRPAYTASYANSRVTVIDTNSGGNISGAFTIATVSAPSNGTITLSVTDGANAVQDVITFTDPATAATFQYSPAFNSNISNIVTGIANTETLPDWSAAALDSDTVRFTALILGYVATNNLVTANITNGLSNGVITTLAVARTVDTNGSSGATLPGGTNGQLQYNANGSFEGTNGITYDATTTLLDIGSFLERATVTGTGITGNISYDIITQSILFYNANATANANINFRGNSSITLNNSMGTGDTITVRLLNTNGATAYLPVNYTIDGSNVTPVWLNGAAPTAANANSTMQYQYTIVKTAANTYTVLASQQRFA